MLKFTKARIAYIFLFIVFVVIEIFIIKNKIKKDIEPTNIMGKININMDAFQEIKSEETNIEKENSKISKLQKGIGGETKEWRIEIPAIGLNANISEGTTQEILNQYIGHFEETQKEIGNIGLAAHNRGYRVNYFQNLKKLRTGDEIKYTYNGFEKIYEVEKCRIIKDIDWEYLENTEDNRLTLITCVENQPEYRRCIQAIEKDY